MVNIRKTRYIFWILQAFFKRHFTMIILGATLGVVASIVFIVLVKRFPYPSKRITIGLIGEVTKETLPQEVLTKLSLGLTNVAPDGQPLPGLATSWSVSPDLLTYTFHLNPSIKWVDGTPVKAGELDYHFKDASMTSTSPSTVEIKLKESYTPLPVVVSRPLFKDGLLGTGIYKVSSVKSSGDNISQIDLSARIGTGKDDLSYHFYPTEESALTAWKLGEVKILNDLIIPPPSSWNPKIEKKVRKDRFVGLFFNLQDPDVQDKSLRQALAYAIKNKTQEGTQRALGPISPDSWAASQNLKKYDYDKKRAIQLIGNVATKSASIHVTISTFSTLLPLAETIKNDWQDLGITVQTQVVSATPDQYQILLATQAIPPDPDQYNLWHSTQNTNFTHLKNPKIDKLLEDGRKTDGMAARKATYFEFQKTMVEDLPAIFLYHPITYTISRP